MSGAINSHINTPVTPESLPINSPNSRAGDKIYENRPESAAQRWVGSSINENPPEMDGRPFRDDFH